MKIVKFLLPLLMTVQYVHATVGSINDQYHYARVCHNSNCSIYGIINFKPTGTDPVIVNDSKMEGYIWGDELGWINLNPSDGGVIVSSETGIVSGTAYSSVGGFINFSPSNGGVRINAAGEFIGYAWVGGLYGGWIKFNCDEASACVKTDWRPRINNSSSGNGISGANNSKPSKDLSTPSNVNLGSLPGALSLTASSQSLTVSSSTKLFKKPLSPGMTHADVVRLQMFLIQENVYPEKILSNYYGSLTKKAVQRFQLKYKITTTNDLYYGYVGPRTLAKINSLIK